MELMKRCSMPLILLAALCFAGAVPMAHADTGTLEVRYTGSDEEQVIAGAELFSHVDNGLPGDVFVGSLNVVNASPDTCEVSVYAQDVKAKGPEDMLDRIPFTIEAGGTTVFNGVLTDMESAESIDLGSVGSGEIMAVNCTAAIPSELTSEYADAAVGLSMAVGLHGYDDGTALVSTGASQGANIVHAGDMLSIAPFVLGTAVAAGAVIWCAWKRRIRMW